MHDPAGVQYPTPIFQGVTSTPSGVFGYSRPQLLEAEVGQEATRRFQNKPPLVVAQHPHSLIEGRVRSIAR